VHLIALVLRRSVRMVLIVVSVVSRDWHRRRRILLLLRVSTVSSELSGSLVPAKQAVDQR
jgi:hypothetical protein